MNAPSIRKVKSDQFSAEYEICGGDLAPGWDVRPGKAASCRFTIWHGRDTLGSYGGEVWPLAWPKFFEAIRPSVTMGSAGVRLTEAGMAALAAL